MRLRSLTTWVASIVAVVLAASPALAGFTRTFDYSNSDLSAKAVFTYNDSTQKLTIVLTNLDTNVKDNAEVLNNFYFNQTDSSVVLTSFSAKALSGSNVIFDNKSFASTADFNVGGEFVYKSSAFKATGIDFNVGIASSGRDSFGVDSPLFSTGTLQQFLDTNYSGSGTVTGGPAPDGPTGGIVGPGTSGANKNSAFIQSSVTFTLDVSVSGGATFTAEDLQRVAFAYGTSSGDTIGIVPDPGDGITVPAPAGLVLLASAVPFGLALRRRALRKTA